MPNISNIQVDSTVYQIKDAMARGDLENLQNSLGNLAFKDSASTNYKPEGTISGIQGSVTPATTTINSVTNNGSLPQWSASVNDETLSFNFNPGTKITTQSKNVVTGINDIEITGATFNGKESEVTVK